MSNITVTHQKVSSGTVNTDVEVDLSDWNATHTVTGLDEAIAAAVPAGTANHVAYYPASTAAIGSSPYLIQGTTPFGGAVLTGLTIESTPTYNARNGTTICNGVGANGSGATIIMWAQNGTFAAPTAIVTQQELGSVSVLGWTGSAFAPAANNTGIIFTSIEAWTPTANGCACVFQATPIGGVFANNEVSIANGVQVLGSNTTLGEGLGWGTLNAANGLYDNTKRVVSATSPNITITSANAFTVGATGATNPAFRVDSSTGTGTGICVTSQAAAGGVGVAVVSSGTNEGIAINGKGTGTITLANVSTGAVNVASSLKVTSSSASAFAVGLNGTTNPALTVDASAALQATGVQISGAAAGSGAGIAAISSGTNEALAINAKGSSQIVLGNVSTGTVNIAQAMTYGGVLLTNAVTGTGSMVLSTSPTLVTPALGTPASGVATNLTGTAAGLIAGNVAPPQGRLTLQTVVPVMTSTQSAKTTIFYTPHRGNLIPLYNGTNMVPTTFAEISVATTDTAKNPAAIGASKVNDWFVWTDSGTIRISHGPDWTSDTARSAGTALVMVNGILLNNASITNGPAASRGTYVGTTRSNGSSQLDWILGAAASGGTAGFLGVWNAYNRVMVGTSVSDSGAGYTYTAAAIRQARASAGNQVSMVVGLQEDSALVSYGSRVDTVAASGAGGGFGVNMDSTSTYGGQNTSVNAIGTAAQISAGYVVQQFNVAIGLHVFSANENSDGTNANTFNNGAKAIFSVQMMM